MLHKRIFLISQIFTETAPVKNIVLFSGAEVGTLAREPFFSGSLSSTSNGPGSLFQVSSPATGQGAFSGSLSSKSNGKGNLFRFPLPPLALSLIHI
eukprot:2276301-Pyramimonas_sp.AAC.1